MRAFKPAPPGLARAAAPRPRFAAPRCAPGTGHARGARPVGRWRPAAAGVQEVSSHEGEGEADELQELSTAQQVRVVDGFAPELVQELRGVFDARFADPRATTTERFLWDHWYCPDARGTTQYHLVRTQAQAYFSPAQCAALEDALLAFGESLGCRGITPPWVSYYTDGMLQELHCDNPQGPFAYVLSLTNWEGRSFTGGETIIATPTLTNYWAHHVPSKGLEHHSLFELVPPLFGRLTVFDPRYPHGVREVRGTRDPRLGRLVIHGWFTTPEPFFTGALDAGSAARALDEAVAGAVASLAEGEDGDGDGVHVTGILTMRVSVAGSSGRVTDVEFVADTLVVLPSSPLQGRQARALVQHELDAWLRDATFPTAQGDTCITLPVVFE